MIELQETNTFDDLDRLSVFLFDEDTIGIKVGENVEIIGEIKILENNFKYFPYLYCESIKYINKQNFIQTDSDIEKIKEFNETHKNKPGVLFVHLLKFLTLQLWNVKLRRKVFCIVQ